MTFDGLRAQFPSAERCIHLNHAGLSPTSLTVREAILAATDSLLGDGDTLAAYMAHIERERALRAALGRLLRVEPATLGFVRNTSHGLAIAAQALPLEPGGTVVCMRTDYPSTVYPWQALARNGVHTQLVEPTESALLDACQNPAVKVLCASWVHWGTGAVLDLNRVGRFCRERGILFVCDIVQGLGAIRPDLRFVDIAAAGCHKWLLTPAGIGVLYIRPEVLPTLLPTNVGWNWVENPIDWDRLHFDQPKPGTARFEEGSPGFVATAGLLASVELLESVGFDAVQERVLALASYARTRLLELGMTVAGERVESGIVGFRHPQIANDDVLAALDAGNVRAAIRSGWVRFSPHAYSTEDEIDRAVAAVPGQPHLKSALS